MSGSSKNAPRPAYQPLPQLLQWAPPYRRPALGDGHIHLHRNTHKQNTQLVRSGGISTFCSVSVHIHHHLRLPVRIVMNSSRNLFLASFPHKSNLQDMIQYGLRTNDLEPHILGSILALYIGCNIGTGYFKPFCVTSPLICKTR